MDIFFDILPSPPHLVLAPLQAGGYMSLLPLCVGGPPDRLVDAIERWSEEYTEELVTSQSRAAFSESSFMYIKAFAHRQPHANTGTDGALTDTMILVRP